MKIAIYTAALAILCLSLYGCSAWAPDEPSIPEEEIVAVLADLHLVEARTLMQYEPIHGLQDSVLAQHGRTRGEFDAVMAFYARHPERYVELYRKVVDHLSERVPPERAPARIEEPADG